MATTLLKTKLFIPSLRTEHVSRPHLVRRLNAGLQGKLTLLSAPAGFGKTSLLSEWAAECERGVAWVSLDEGDDNPVLFLSYLIAALQRIDESIGEASLVALHAAQPSPVDAFSPF
jgi:LuxR family maltose regulon positive regulatory protein